MVSSDHFGRENILYKGLKVLGKWEVTEYVLVFKNRARLGICTLRLIAPTTSRTKDKFLLL